MTQLFFVLLLFVGRATIMWAVADCGTAMGSCTAKNDVSLSASNRLCPTTARKRIGASTVEHGDDPTERRPRYVLPRSAMDVYVLLLYSHAAETLHVPSGSARRWLDLKNSRAC